MLTTDHPRTIDRIEQELVACESMIAQLRGRQLELVREADQAQVCAVDGARSLSDWLAGRLDLHPMTARAMTAAATSASAEVQEDLAGGHISFDRSVATARLVAAGADDATVSRSLGIAVNNVVALTAQHRRMTPLEESEIFDGRHLVAQPNLANTAWRVHGQLPAFDGEIVFDALDRTADTITGRGPDRPPLPQRRADALVAWALDATEPAGADRPTRSIGMATVFVDSALAARTSGEAGAGTRHGVKVGPNTLNEILCSGTVEVVQECAETVHKIGKAGSAIPPEVRTAVWRRDLGCTIDGCTSSYRLEPHHIVEQRHGGDHRLGNLTLLCWFHHHVVIHQQGFRLDPGTPPGRRRLLRPERPPDSHPPW